MSRQLRISLPVEIKSRELRGKVWLALSLARRGHRIALGGKDDVFTAFDVLRPDVHFDTGPVAHDARTGRFEALAECGTEILVLDTEGGALKPDSYRDRVDARALELASGFLAWGEQSAEIAREAGGCEATVVGNPRFDLLSERLRAVHRPAADELVEEYGQYVLVNTAFGVNNVDLETLREHTDHDHAVFRHQSTLIGAFVQGVAAISEAMPETTIVVRPHPIEDEYVYEQLLWPFENVVVEGGGDVTPWLLGSRAIVHHSCTTAIEGTLLGKPVVSYEPTDRSAHDRHLPNLLSDRVSTTDELVTAVREADGSRPHEELTDEQWTALKRHFTNVDGRAAERIANLVDDLDPDAGGDFGSVFEPNSLLRAKRATLRLFGQEWYDRYYRQGIGQGRAHQTVKFDGLSAAELRDELDALGAVVDVDGVTIEEVPGVENTFWITVDRTADPDS